MVRPKLPLLTAVQIAGSDQTVTLADGRVKHGVAGDWLIARGKVIIDLVGPEQLSEAYQIVDGNERLLTRAMCTKLEETLGIGATRTPEDFLAAVERLAKIEVGTVKVEFTPGQLEEIKYRATKRGQTIQQALQAVVDRIKEEIFWRS